VEQNTPYFIVNTNKTWMHTAWESMLNQKRAAAYWGRKHAIRKIPKGSFIYLYHTSTGIIAKGQSTEGCQKDDIGEHKDAEFYVPLDFEWALSERKDWAKKAVPSWEINRALNTGHRFRQTVFSISKGMAEKIDELHSNRDKSSL